jgi:predicted RecA/RadA family phage recombinase
LPLDPPPGAKVRTEQFVTVGDVASFAVANMPAGNAGSLSTEEYLAVLAFDLKANGITLDEPLDLETAEKLTIPR